MATTTPINGFPIAEDGDNLDIVQTLGVVAEDIEDKMISWFSDNLDRITKLPVPPENKWCYVASTKTIEIYRDEGWQVPYPVGTVATTTTHVVGPPVDVTGLSHTLIEGCSYAFQGFIVASAASSDSLLLSWSLPANTFGIFGVRDETEFTSAVDVDSTLTLSVSAGMNMYSIWGFFQDCDSGQAQLQFDVSSGLVEVTISSLSCLSFLQTGGDTSFIGSLS